ncbi:MAG TPA: hypothetical protein VHD84_01015 [Candidatus Saccharimonadales bacterium]|nr:hypothetical protein [Candidatus Saccharimonadales bacterium]
MAEPARQLGPDSEQEPKQPEPGFKPRVIQGGGDDSSGPQGRLSAVPSEPVYDEPSGTAPTSERPQLKALEGGGQSSEPDSSWYHPESSESSLEDLSQAEKSSSDNKSPANNPNSYYQPHHDDNLGGLANIRPSIKGAFGFARNNRGKLILGGVAASFITLLIIAFFAIIPFKILHIVDNLQSRFTASADNAVESETDALFSNYVRKYILPAHKQCGVIIESSCNPIPTSTNPVTRLYKGWRNAKFEDQIAKKYGIEFGYNTASKTYYMKTPLSTNDIDLTDFVDNNPSNLTLDQWLEEHTPGLAPATRSEIRQAVKDATANESLWKRTYVRFKFRRFLSEKYGIPNCIFFCETKDKLAGSINDQKNAAKLALNRLVLTPRDRALGIVLECLLSDCDPTVDQTTTCQEGVDCELNGAPENPETDTQVRKTLGSLAAEYGGADAAELETLYQQVVDKGITQVTVERVLAQFMGQSAASVSAETAVKAFSVVGWILLANQVANVVNAANNSNADLKKLSYIVNAAAAVNLFGVYRVYADEIKTGQANANEVGSLVNSLGPAVASLQDAKGGTASAEQSPLYSYLLGDGKPTPSSSYKCDNGSTPSATSVKTAVCPEEVLGGVDNGLLEKLHEGLSSSNSPFYIIGQAARIWSSVAGKLGLTAIIGSLNSAISAVLSPVTSAALKTLCIPVPLTHTYLPDPAGFCELRDAVQKGAQYIGQAMVSYLIPDPFSENMSGGRTFDMMAAGADVSGNEFAHNGLGGKELTPQQAADNYNQQALEDKQQYDSQSFFARMFDTSSEYSPITKLAMALPDSKTEAMQSIGSFFTEPFKKVASAFGSIFSGQAFAAATAQPDPFGVTQYGYTNDDPNLTAANQDPQTYWKQNCADGSQTKQWNEQAAEKKNIDPITGMPVNTTTDPCLLIQASVGADGALFDSSLLTQDDLGSQ